MNFQDENEKLIISVKELKALIKKTTLQNPAFLLGGHFNAENIVEIAKSQFPRLEAKVAIQKEIEETKRLLTVHQELEKTKRLLIVIAAVCLIAGAIIVTFAPNDKEKVSYILAVALLILPLGAIGIQEFRIRTLGINVEGGKKVDERIKE